MTLITKIEKFVNDLVAHVFVSLETEIVYESTLDKSLPKGHKKRDGRVIPDKFYGLKKYTYRKVLCGLTSTNVIKAAKVIAGQVPEVNLEPSGWNVLGSNHVLYEHETTHNKAIKGYWGDNLIDTKSVSAYETTDGKLLTDDEIKELYSYMSEKKATYGVPLEFRNYIIEKVKYFRNGSFEMNDLSDAILHKLGLR